MIILMQIVGAFLGAVATWLVWVPHFKTVPEPPAPSGDANLLRKRDALAKNAIEIVSYKPHNPWLAVRAAEGQRATNVQANSLGCEASLFW